MAKSRFSADLQSPLGPPLHRPVQSPFSLPLADGGTPTPPTGNHIALESSGIVLLESSGSILLET